MRVLPSDDTLARSLDFPVGAGDRGAGLYDAGTRKRLAGVKETYDPANLFRGNHGVSACRPASRRWAARPSPERP
ncbi:BBE domain-containing protein [Streptomyces olivaceoviridis]|uniref:BBE domain-containing protein n=1 Tax=Streptomyces olivaceoviridis TaxID=1921 RepID=UPI0036F8B8A8